MTRTPQAVTSLIKRYGVTVSLITRQDADKAKPWMIKDTEKSQAVSLKGLIQKMKADQQERLPEGGLKAVIVMRIESGQTSPKPGDDLKIEEVIWRVSTVLPLAMSRQAKIVEVMVTARGNDEEGQA